MKKVSVFCIPFAGGSSYSYYVFKNLAPLDVDVIPIELPGRGSRITESLKRCADELAWDIFHQIKSRLSVPYIIYGHSMGAILSIIVTRKIRDAGLPQPIRLIVTGAKGPSVPCESKRYLLPADEFNNELRRLGGSPDELLADAELLKFFEPILRADFAAVETYEHRNSNPIEVPITVAIGLDEDISRSEVEAWRSETLAQVDIKYYPGKHFFIFNHPAEIVGLMAETCLEI